MSAPAPLSAAYSEMNLQLTLVTTRDSPVADAPAAQVPVNGFEQRVARVGARLAAAAYRQYPELRDRVEGFEFVIADKSEPGTASTATGRVVVLRPVGALARSEAALAFVLAREMGHVIADHHAENTGASLAVSGIAYLLFPVAGLARVLGSLFVPGGAAASSSLVANASSTAASIVGSRIVEFSSRPQQRREADAIAVNLLHHAAYDVLDVMDAFAAQDFKPQESEWLAALQASVGRLGVDDPPLE